MHWIIIALIAPFVWSIINHVDKYLVSKYFKGGGIGGIMVFVGIIAGLFLPIVYFIDPAVLAIAPITALMLFATGLLYNVAVLLYLYALEHEDASLVVPFWQLVPVFSYFLGVFFLGQSLSGTKILASFVVILGALLLSIKLDGANTHIKKNTIWLMVFSSLACALGNVWFSDGVLDSVSFWVSLFWNQVGMLVFGFACLLVKSYREQFFLTIRTNSSRILGLNLLEQVGETVGIVVNNYAITLAPVAVVVLLEYSVQPTFVFLEGIILTLLLPQFVKEDISKKNLLMKAVAIVVMSVGVYLLVR